VTKKRENIILGAIFLAIAIGYFIMATQLPARNLPNTLGIDAMPRAFGIFLAFLSILLIIGGFTDKEGKAASSRVPLSWPHLRGVIIVFAAITAYIVLIDILGFVIVTPFLMFGLMYIEGVRKWVSMIIVSLVTTGVVYVLFRYVFEVKITGFGFM